MKTVRVRVAVAVTPQGDWNAYGKREGGVTKRDDEMSLMASGWFNPLPNAVCFVEADVPVPEALTIQGDVVK